MQMRFLSKSRRKPGQEKQTKERKMKRKMKMKRENIDIKKVNGHIKMMKVAIDR